MLGRDLIESAMQRALSLARRGPQNDPNPQVGCVLVDRDGRIISEGWHRGAGTPHAEVDALAHLPEAWRTHTQELTAVVTLEPCNHTGRTGPCAEALREAGLGAVVYALADPSPIAGGGAKTLRQAGIEVLGPAFEREARAVLGPWLARQQTSAEAQDRTAPIPLPRPHVTVKWAQTLDGRAAAADGSSQWITGKAARTDVHVRRAEADAILVGTGTLLSDDPELTARASDGGLLVPASEQPIPVVLGRREVPASARIRNHPALAAHDIAAPLTLPGTDLARDLAELHERGICRLFVEGGPTVASAFLAAGLVDTVLVYIAPALLGGPRVAIGDLGIESMAGIHRLQIDHTAQLGTDLLVVATFPDPKETP